MKEIKETYEPIDQDLHQELEALQTTRKYIRIHYFNHYHEYISAAGIIKEITKLPAGEFLILNTGDEIRLDKIVRLEGKPAPGYDKSDFTCDC